MKITVPNSWTDVTIEQFDKLVELSNNTELSLSEREIRIISVLTKLDYKDVAALDAPSFEAISNSLSFLNKKPEKSVPKEKITLLGKSYHVDLVPTAWTAAQFLDYKVIAGMDIDKKSARLIACFIYPEGSKYNDDSYDNEELVDVLYRNLSVPEVTGLTDFFMLQFTAFAKALLAYSRRQIQKSKVMSEQEKKKILEEMKNAKDTIANFGTLG